MGKTINIRRGFDIRMEGSAPRTVDDLSLSDIIAVKPADFHTVIPKLHVEVGDEVLAGQTLFHDKNRPDILFSAPVSGEIAEIVRGEKRRILEIRILPDKKEIRYASFPVSDPSQLSRGQVTERLLESGCWNYIRQRPFSIIANPEEEPKAIFVSCFDSAPLAPDLDFIVSMEKENFQAGLMALRQLAGTDRLHLGLRATPQEGLTESDFEGIHADNMHRFQGPHPAGNVGIQIHHINPIQKGETVWFVHPQDVLIIGRLFREGRYRADRLVAVTGSCVQQRGYVRTMTGQRMNDILANRLNDATGRVIFGNVLSGSTAGADDFLSYYENQITVIPEGNQPEFLGWLLPGFRKLSRSRTYFSWLFPKRRYQLDTNMHGEERAFVMTGQYDKVLPMNIYPVILLKAILAKDIERMEALGIYEIAEEDFALCEFVCTSKIDVQKIVAEGLDFVRLEA